MILGYYELHSRIRQLFPNRQPPKIGAASVDVTVGRRAEREYGTTLNLQEYSRDNPYLMHPGEFLLAEMLEEVHVPQDLSCMFLLKSTSARMGFQHAFAGWVDPGWRGVLTMELTNAKHCQYIPIYTGFVIGQLIFMETCHAGRYEGRYQYDAGVSGPKQEVPYDAGS